MEMITLTGNDMEAIAKMMVEKEGGMVTYRADGRDVDASYLIDDNRKGVKVDGIEHYDEGGNLLWSAGEEMYRALENECLYLLIEEGYERRKEREEEREFRVNLQRVQGMVVCRW